MKKEEMAALAQRISPGEKRKAQMVQLFPQLATMGEACRTLGVNPEAVQLVVAEAREQAQMHGISSNHTLGGWQVVAREPIKRFYAQLASLNAFSTTYAQEYVLPGNPNVLPKLEVPIYDDSGDADIDNYDNFDTRDSGKSTSAEITLHKIDKVATIYARDIQQGINPEAIIEGLISSVAKGVQDFVFDKIKVGAAQADDSTKTIESLAVPEVGNADGQFNFGYANQVLSEAIQPRVHAMLVDSAHYGAMKAANKESLTASDVDVDLVCKVQNTAKLGTGAVGVIANKRGAAVGLAAPLFMAGAYSSVEQMTHEGQNCPLSIATYYLPGINAIKVVCAVMVGVAVTDASAVKVLVEGSSKAGGKS